MKRIALVVFPGFQILDLAAAGVFEIANLQASRPAYEIDVVSESGGAVKSSVGAAIHTIALDPEAYDTVLVSGWTTPQPVSPKLLRQVERAFASTRRLASICSGAFVLAEAGVLHGRRATTHWLRGRELQRAFPAIRVEEDRIFVRDGTVWTSAGMTACVDLSLALVEDDLGAEVSRAVAKKLVVHHRRAGGQSQFSLLSELESQSNRIQGALTYAKNHLDRDLSVEVLADAAHMSPRHFSREFRQHTGQRPRAPSSGCAWKWPACSSRPTSCPSSASRLAPGSPTPSGCGARSCARSASRRRRSSARRARGAWPRAPWPEPALQRRPRLLTVMEQ